MAKQSYFNADAFIENMEAQIDRGSLIQADWIVKNFTSPRNNNLAWSYKDHEYQIEIANCGDDVPTVWVKKCAQVGLSTLELVLALAFCALHDYLKLAYVLPTAKFATEFSAMRMDPAILSSPKIASLVSKDTDNVGMKKIGTCFLIMRGTSGETQAISIDLDCLVIDEYNFANQKILSTFSSRLQHSLLKLRRNFSTPTLPEYGVSGGYDTSSQGLRAVFCTRCNHWVFPSFFADVVIPGFAKPLNDFRAIDKDHQGVKDAYLSCPNCRKALTIENLNDPDKREWVHRNPTATAKGFHVMPWDVPKYNPIPEILADIENYTYQDWCNFRLGLDYESSENSFQESVINTNSVIPPISIETIRLGLSGIYGGYLGSDLGKTNHVIIGIPSVFGTLDIVCLARVDVKKIVADTGDVHFGPWLRDIFVKIAGRKSVIDHAPAWEPALHMVSTLPDKAAYGAYYSANPKKGNLDIYSFDDNKGAVTIERDRHLDDLCEAVNNGKIRFLQKDHPEMSIMRKHLKNIKKVKQTNSKGQNVETWVSLSSDDHYAHALGYLWAAYSSDEHRPVIIAAAMPPSPSRVKVKG